MSQRSTVEHRRTDGSLRRTRRDTPRRTRHGTRHGTDGHARNGRTRRRLTVGERVAGRIGSREAVGADHQHLLRVAALAEVLLVYVVDHLEIVGHLAAGRLHRRLDGARPERQFALDVRAAGRATVARAVLRFAAAPAARQSAQAPGGGQRRRTLVRLDRRTAAVRPGDRLPVEKRRRRVGDDGGRLGTGVDRVPGDQAADGLRAVRAAGLLLGVARGVNGVAGVPLGVHVLGAGTFAVRRRRNGNWTTGMPNRTLGDGKRRISYAAACSILD